MLWIKEVEMVESVDDFKSSRLGIPGPNFEVLDAKIASALNKIIQNTRFQKKVSLGEMKAQKEDHFLRGRQIAYLIYEYFRVTYWSQRFCRELCRPIYSCCRNDDIQEFGSKWDEIFLSMTQIPSDDIWESFYKLRIRESEKLKTVQELYNMEIHQKKLGPDYHRLKTMVKRSLSKIYERRILRSEIGNYETSAWSRIRGQNSVNKEV